MTPRKLWIDLETFSSVAIKHGAHRYATQAEIILLAWALDDGPVSVWDCTLDPLPPAELLHAEFDEIWAHNSGFDRTVLRACKPHLVPTEPSHWRDTMVQAYAHGLPGALGTLCDILGVPTDKAKDKEGKTLIRLFCIPPAKNLKRGRATRETHPQEWAKFVEYAALDIEAMREVHRRLPRWNYQGDELALWHLDQRINDRGVMIDMDLARGAIRAVERAQADLKARTQELTGGEVESTTKRDQFLAHLLEQYGVALPDVQISTLERRLSDPDLDAGLRELLAIRLQASSTSTAKYNTLINATNDDDRLRGVLQFDGAGRTRRWAGRLFQPQNLPRPTLKNDDIDFGIEAIKLGAAHLFYE
jgi:DNA polymerase